MYRDAPGLLCGVLTVAECVCLCPQSLWCLSCLALKSLLPTNSMLLDGMLTVTECVELALKVFGA